MLLEHLSWSAHIAGPMIVAGGELIGIGPWPVRLAIGGILLGGGLYGKGRSRDESSSR